ncbi:hypothetical protein L1887_05136 [Cichorium endivia]|nr:hypothetical protein L1887_14479 [Cichorium endivia]KAI3525995.1 hypothetical protein L1887_05136 [Cichorium endivia]
MCALPLEGCLLANKITQPRTLKTGSMYPRFEVQEEGFYVLPPPLKSWKRKQPPSLKSWEREQPDIMQTSVSGHSKRRVLHLHPDVASISTKCEECKSSEELNCPNYDKKGSTGSNHRNAEMGQMFEVLNEGKGRIPKTPSEEVQTKEKPKEFADEQEKNWWQEYEMNW